MKNNDFQVYRMPPEGSFLGFSLLRAQTLPFSYRSKVAEMGANAKETVWREAERRVCGYGKTGTFVNDNHGGVSLLMTNIIGPPSRARSKNHQRPR